MTQYTPTPWHFAPGELIYGPNGESIASCRFVTNFPDENKENMRFIVRAVNSHEALLEMCRQSLNYLWAEGAIRANQQEPSEADVLRQLTCGESKLFTQLKEAIAQAEGN